MGSATRFPNLEEFRARASRLGRPTDDADALPPPPGGIRTAPAGVPWLWLGAALVAAIALIWLAVSPGSVRIVSPERAPVPSISSVEEDALAARLASMEEQIASIGRQAADAAATARALRERLDRIEDALGPMTGSIDRWEDPLGPSDFLLDEAPPSLASAPPALPARPAAGAERSAIGPAVAFAVDLGGFGDLGDLKRHWAELVGNNPLLLGGLVPRQVTRVEVDGIRSYRLIAGPIDDVETSARICDALRVRGAECAQSINTGEPI